MYFHAMTFLSTPFSILVRKALRLKIKFAVIFCLLKIDNNQYLKFLRPTVQEIMGEKKKTWKYSLQLTFK